MAHEMTAWDCARTLYRRKATLLWIAGFGLVAAALVTLAQPRLYRSEAALQVLAVNDNFLSLRDVYPTAATGAESPVYVQTQAEMLQQGPLIDQVVKKLHLNGRALEDGSSVLGRFRPAARSVADEVRENLQVVPSRGSSIIRIVCQARDPQLAADIPNTLAEAFIEQSIEARQRSARQTYATLSVELEGLRKRLQRSETQLGGPARGPGGGTAGGRKSPHGLGLASWITPYNALEAEVTGERQFYEAMSRRADEAAIASTVRQSNIRLAGAAEPSSRPFKPNVPLNLALGLCGGLVLGIGYVMLQEQNTSAMRTPGDAGACLTLPELGAIPRVGNRGFGALNIIGGGSGKRHVELASLEQPLSGLSESFRATLASILSASKNGSHSRSLVVTSSRPMEGKTTVVSNLGIALADIGNRVLLIDADLRRPRLHKIFNEANSWGLSDMLREKNAIEELPLDVLVRKTAVPRLSLLSSGTWADNIFGLMCSPRMSRLLPRFREEFDYVLVDAPPCLEFADARIMARYSEKLVLVVRADYTDRRTAQAAVQRLTMDGIPVMGVIFNYWDPTRSDAYDYAEYRQDPK
jgi:receptor protein-tyrosine kinase